MWRLRATLLHLFSVLRRGRTDREIDDEVRFHLEMRTEENLRAGLPPDEARRAAERRFGSVWRVKEAGREVRRGTTLDGLARDLRHGWRGLVRRPGFTALVVVTMALGIGVNTSIFCVVNAVLIEPLPYDRPEELTLVWSNFQKMGAPRAPSSGVQLRALRTQSRAFADVAGIWVGNQTITGDGEPEQLKVASVTPNFLAVLGARPALGRSFPPDGPPGVPEVVISHGLWQRRFGGDPDILGRGVRIGRGSYTVVGVMAPDFQLTFPPDANVPADVQAWRPFERDIAEDPTDLFFLRVLGRLAPGATLERAQAEASAVADGLRRDYAEFASESLRFEVVELHADVVRDVRPALLALFAGAALVLAISCFNVMNLLLTRVNAGRKELAIRIALGGSRLGIARQLLVESLLLCLLGGAAGVGVAWCGVRLLMALRPQGLVRIGAVDLELGEALFLAAISIGSGLVAGLAPMFETRKVDVVDSLKAEGRTHSGRVKSRLRLTLIVAEVAMGFVLLVGAGLMVRTVLRLHDVAPGFDPAGVLTFELAPPSAPAEQRTAFVEEWEARLAALPGVRSVGAISHLPLDDYPNWYSPYAPEGVAPDQAAGLLADYRAVTPGYFRAIGARLADGRAFDPFDAGDGRNVVVVDDLLARRTWPNERAVGKRLAVERFTDDGFVTGWAEVVGVVEHVKSHSLLRAVRGQIYIPYAQSAREHLSFVVKAEGDPLALAPAVRRELAALDGTRAIGKVRPMESYVEEAMGPTNFVTALAAVFGALALALAAVGMYGVVSYSVGQRTHEMGVRMALGARPVDILGLVLGEGLRLAAVGLAAGVACSLAVSGYLRELLFEVAPLDPVTFATMAAVTVLATALACWVPARRAALSSLADLLRR